MSVKVTQIEGTKLRAESEGLEIISGRVGPDAPAEGMSPGRLIAASLGLCTGMHVVGYMNHRGIPYRGFEITMEQTNAENPRMCSAFTVTISVQADLTEKQRRDLMAEANRCYVGNTLRGNPEIKLRLKAEP
jgi:uncharacterized OsmC-like protein